MEEIVNPVFASYYGDIKSKWSWSDITKGLRADLALQESNFLFDEEWYKKYQSPEALYAQYKSLGLTDYQINNMLLGSPVKAESGSSPVVSQSGGNPLLDYVTKGLNTINNSIQTDLSMQRQSAEIDHLNSESALNYANAAEVNPLSVSSQFRNYGEGSKGFAGAVESEANAQLIGEKYNLTKQQTRYAEQLADSFKDVNDAELKLKAAKVKEYLSQAASNYEAVNKMKHEENLIDVSAEKVGSEIGLIQQETEESKARTGLLGAETNKVGVDIESQEIQNVHLRLVNDVENVLGVPLSSSEKNIIGYYAKTGDFDGLSNFLQASFDIAAEEKTIATRGFPYSHLRNPAEAAKKRYNVVNPNP